MRLLVASKRNLQYELDSASGGVIQCVTCHSKLQLLPTGMSYPNEHSSRAEVFLHVAQPSEVVLTSL